MKTIRMILLGILLVGQWQTCLGADENTKTPIKTDCLDMPYKDVRQLAEQGDADSQYCLGLKFNEGYGVPQNYAESIKWWKLAAEKGGGYSLFNLGRAYVVGRGVQQDYQAAVSWWTKGAEMRDVLSINELATAYEVGIIVPQDKIQAHKWWNISSALKPAFGSENSTERRGDIEKAMTPAQITEAQKLALKWMENHE